MSEADLRKWDERYRAGAYQGRKHPTALLADLVRDPRMAPQHGRALDVACGTGRNAVFLAEHGFDVDAIDVSEIGLERARAAAAVRGVAVRWIGGDLDRGLDAHVSTARYDLIVLVRYVNMALIPELVSRLADNGLLVIEEHLASTADVAGPSAKFRLAPNALLAAAAGLRVLLYREGIVEDPDGRSVALAQLVACRGSPPFERGSRRRPQRPAVPTFAPAGRDAS
jgi:SAM-dependent methyltransferase